MGLLFLSLFFLALLALVAVGPMLLVLAALIKQHHDDHRPRPRPPALHGPPARVRTIVRKPKPVQRPGAPGYLRKWTIVRKVDAAGELERWQEEFALLERQVVARRAGGLHGSSTAAPGSGG